MIIIGVRGRIGVADPENFLSLFSRHLLLRRIHRQRLEIRIDKRVRVPLPAFARESAVEDARVKQHLPNVRIPPIVRSHLRVQLNPKIVMSSIQHPRHRVLTVPTQTNHVLSQLLERLIESVFVVVRLTIAVGDHTLQFAYEKQNTTLVDSVETCHIGNGVGVHENQTEIIRVENFI